VRSTLIVRALVLTRSAARGSRWHGAWVEITPDFTAWTLPAERAKKTEWRISVRYRVRCARNLEARRAMAEENRPEGVLVRQAPAILLVSGTRRAVQRVRKGEGGSRLGERRQRLAPSRPSPHGRHRTAKNRVRLEVTEAVLNHVSGSRAGIVGIYSGHDYAAEKRSALIAWGEHVGAIVDVVTHIQCQRCCGSQEPEEGLGHAASENDFVRQYPLVSRRSDFDSLKSASATLKRGVNAQPTRHYHCDGTLGYQFLCRIAQRRRFRGTVSQTVKFK